MNSIAKVIILKNQNMQVKRMARVLRCMQKLDNTAYISRATDIVFMYCGTEYILKPVFTVIKDDVLVNEHQFQLSAEGVMIACKVVDSNKGLTPNQLASWLMGILEGPVVDEPDMGACYDAQEILGNIH